MVTQSLKAKFKVEWQINKCVVYREAVTVNLGDTIVIKKPTMTVSGASTGDDNVLYTEVNLDYDSVRVTFLGIVIE